MQIIQHRRTEYIIKEKIITRCYPHNMKKRLFHYRHESLMRHIFICIMLAGISTSLPVYSDATHSAAATLVALNSISNSSATNNKTTNSTLTTPLSKNTLNRKKVLIEESRGLSAFFIFGIAINIVMAITFGWWFVGQWRQSKK